MPRTDFGATWYDTALVVAITVALYYSTAAPDLYYTDCGELAGVATTLGVAHPTGYPLFTLLGYGWVHLPLPGSPICKLNALMIVLGSAAIGMMHRLMVRLLSDLRWLDAQGIRSVATVTALLLATARTIWAQSLSLEVHALQVVLVVHLLYWLVRWKQTGLRRDQLWAAFALGLCFTNHLSSIVLLPGTLLFAWMYNRRQWHQRLRQLLLPAVITLSCAITYAYLPLRSASQPLFNWGEVHRSVGKFLYHVLGKQYSIWMFNGSAREQLGVFWSLLLPNVAVPFALVGIWALWRYARSLTWLILALAVVCVGYTINYSIPDIEPYFATAFIAGVIATGFGIAALWRFRFIRYLTVLLPIVYTVWNWHAVDLRHHRLVREYVRLIVEPLPHGSIVLSQQWDYFCSAFWYMQQVEGYRPDVVLIEKELLRRTWYIHQLERWYGQPITRCSTEIAAYIPLLEEFESGEMPKERYGIIQQAFETLLRGFVERNPDHAAFATPEVLETEPEFAATVSVRPYGATLALDAERHELPPPLVYDARRLLEGSSRYYRERLDRGLTALASLAYIRTGDALLATDSTAIERARQSYRIALQLDQKSSAARERLSTLGRR